MVMLSTCCNMLVPSALLRSIYLKRMSTMAFHCSIDETAGFRVQLFLDDARSNLRMGKDADVDSDWQGPER